MSDELEAKDMEKDNNNGSNIEKGGDDDFVFSPDAVDRWANQNASGASSAAEGGMGMPPLEPIPMDLVEGELERAERGEAVDDDTLGRIAATPTEGGERELSAYEKKEKKQAEKKRKREEEENVPFKSGSQNLSDWCKNKSSQTEMTKVATMRKEEVRNDARRSGMNPGLEGRFEGAAGRHGVEIMTWDELEKSKRRDLTRMSEGKFKKKKLSGDAKRRRKEQMQRHAREEISGSRRREEREREERRKEREERERRGGEREISPISKTPRMNLERTILNKGPDPGRRPPTRSYVTSTSRPQHYPRQHDLRGFINFKGDYRRREEAREREDRWREERKKEEERKERQKRREEEERKDMERKRKEVEEEKRRETGKREDPMEGMKRKMYAEMQWIRSSNWGRKKEEEDEIRADEQHAKHCFAYIDKTIGILRNHEEKRRLEMEKIEETRRKQQEYLRSRRGAGLRQEEEEKERKEKERKEKERKEGEASKGDLMPWDLCYAMAKAMKEERKRKEEEEKRKEREREIASSRPGTSGTSQPRQKSPQARGSSSDEELEATTTSTSTSASIRQRREDEDEEMEDDAKTDRAREMAEDYGRETGELDQLKLAGMFEMFKESLDGFLDAREKKKKEERKARKKAREEDERKERESEGRSSKEKKDKGGRKRRESKKE